MLLFNVAGCFGVGAVFPCVSLFTFDQGRGHGKLGQRKIERTMNGKCGKPNPTICRASEAKGNSGYAIFKHVLALPYGF